MFDRCIYFNLSTLTRRISKIWQDEFARLGLSASHGYLLSAMATKPTATQKELSELLELDASTITRFIDALSNKNLIDKTSSGKGAQFALTDRGLETAAKINRLMDNLFSNMQKTFGQTEFTKFVGHLQQAKQTLETNNV